MATAQKLMTAEEFQELPDPKSGEQMELVRGVVVLTPLSHASHGYYSFAVGNGFHGFVRNHKLGFVTGQGGYCRRRNPDTVRAPDAAWVAFDRLPDGKLPEDAYPDASPNLAVEVVSPNDREIDIDEKVADYLAAGSDRVWVVRPRARTITVHRPNGDAHRYVAGDTLTSDDAGFPIDGFQLPVTRVSE